MSISASHESQFKIQCAKESSMATDPMERLRLKCLARGTSGIKHFARTFRIMDDDRSLSLRYEEFKTGLQDYQMREDDVKKLFDRLDKDGTGTISFDEFLIGLRPKMNQRRQMLVDKAFRKLDSDDDGIITTHDIKRVYSASRHPKYLNGEWTEQRVYEAYLKNFDSPNDVDYKVTKEEFYNYYCGVSASIDQDSYFDLMMKQAWKI